MAYTIDTVTYRKHDREWTGALNSQETEPWLFAHVKARVTIGAAGAIGQTDIRVDGLLKEAYVLVPDTLSGLTVTLQLQTEDGDLIVNTAALARGARSQVVAERVLMGTTSIFIISDIGAGGEAASRDIEVSLRIQRQ